MVGAHRISSGVRFHARLLPWSLAAIVPGTSAKPARRLVMSISEWLFNPSGLTPHGFCLLWAPGLIFLHAASDAVIGLAYFSIPLALASFSAQRKDLEYGWVAYLFVAFILACGMTHLMSILTLWVPAYGIEGII